MTYVWVMAGAFAASLIELMAAHSAVPLPCFAAAAYYYIMTLSLERALPGLLIVGTLMDLAFGRQVPVSIIVIPALIWIARFWCRQGDCHHPVLQLFPGALVGFSAGASALIFLRLPGTIPSPGSLARDSALTGISTLMGAVIVPLICWQYDRLAARLAFPCYRRVQNRHAGETTE